MYMSTMTRSIDMLPMVFLKNTSSMVCAETVLSPGTSSSSLPNRNGCVGYAVAAYLLSVSCVCSWNATMLGKSFSCLLFESSEDDDDDEDEDADDEDG